MQNFLLNNAMANFLNIKDSAKMYDLVMKLLEIYKSRFSLDFHTIKYEDLISNFKGSVSNLLNFWWASIVPSSLTPQFGLFCFWNYISISVGDDDDGCI